LHYLVQEECSTASYKNIDPGQEKGQAADAIESFPNFFVVNWFSGPNTSHSDAVNYIDDNECGIHEEQLYSSIN
jgi:hypothetical protein